MQSLSRTIALRIASKPPDQQREVRSLADDADWPAEAMQAPNSGRVIAQTIPDYRHKGF
jgi:hypothetical protein